MADLDKELEHIEQGEAWDESDEIVQVEVKRPLDKVIPIRLPAAEWEKIRKEAGELGIGPTTLARMWILERLRIQSSYLPEWFRFSRLCGSAFSESLSSLLNPLEIEVLDEIAQGHFNKHIAEKLGISMTALQNHIEAIKQKLGSREKIATSTKPKRET